MTQLLPITGAAPARRPSTPYARRLARERGFDLAALTGTGPNGRITAADIAGYVPVPEPVPVPATSVPAASSAPLATAALAASVDLAALHRLLAEFTAAGRGFGLQDAVVRAAGCILDELPAAAPDGRGIALELGRRQVVFADVTALSIGPLQARRLAATQTDDPAVPAALSVKVIEAGPIRPVLMPLLPGRRLRLVVIAGGETAEVLLVFDTTALDEDLAADFLTRLKACLETPLRLLV